MDLHVPKLYDFMGSTSITMGVLLMYPSNSWMHEEIEQGQVCREVQWIVSVDEFVHRRHCIKRIRTDTSVVKSLLMSLSVYFNINIHQVYFNFKVFRIKCGRSSATKSSKCSSEPFGSHVWRRLLDPLDPGSLGVFDVTISGRSPVESEALSKLLLRLEEEVSNGVDRSW